jgi:signal transduction histidine kinase
VVADNGRGFDPSAPRPDGVDGGFGLPGIRERAASVDGEVAITSAPGGGTTITFRVGEARP